jgi:hypothetical protein
MSKEKWKWIPGFEGHYRASTKGRIRSVDRWVVPCNGVDPYKIKGKVLVQCNGTRGYKVVSLMRDWGVERKAKNYMVHYLILITFKGPKPKRKICRHLDGNHTNNKPRNLKWGTSQQNSDDRTRHGRHQECPKGEKHWKAKTTSREVLLMRALWRSGKHTQREIAEMFGLSKGTVIGIVKYREWKHLP